MFLFVEFEEKMSEMQQATNDCDPEVLKMVDMVKSSFKKSGVWSSKKLVKYVPQRLKEVIIMIYFNRLSLDCYFTIL